MDTTTPPQTVQTPESPAQPNPAVLPDQPTKKNSNMFLIGAIVVLVLVLAGAVAWVAVGQTAKPAPAASLPLPTELPMPTTNPIQPVVSVASASPTAKISTTSASGLTPSAKPTMIPNPDGNTFTSSALGIAFYYANTMGYDKNTTIKILEEGSKVYIYEKSMAPTTGQSIEKFSKSPSDTLTQAITKKFLTGIPTTDCFVKLDPVKPKPTITKATISYPIPANADQPNFTYGEKCPEHYSESNGMAYFLYDSTYPDRFYYVSIGQYGIPAYNTKPDSLWQDTIIIY